MIRNYLLGWLVILGCYAAGEILVAVLAIPLPGALIGLLVLFIVMQRHQNVNVISTAAQPLLNHMSFFFIPAILGIGLYWSQLEANISAILLAIVGSTMVSLALSYFIALKLFTMPKKPKRKP